MKKQKGFTLVEFMVAMAVTMVVIAAVVGAFRDASRTNQNVTLKSDMSDNLRAGLNLLEEDLIQAGTGIPTGGIAIPSNLGDGSCGLGADGITPLPISALINRPTLPPGTLTFPHCNLILPAIEPGQALGPFITSPDATSSLNTDIITILYADNTVGLDQSPIFLAPSAGDPGCPNGSISPTGNAVTFDPSPRCKDISVLASVDVQIKPGDLIMFSNDRGTAIQQVTSVSGQTLSFAPGDAFNFNGNPATAGTMRNLQNLDTSGNPNGTYPPTTSSRIWMITYYLDNTTDPAHARMIRRVNFNAGQPVGETLENLQFTYNYSDGLAVNQPGVPTGYSENQIRSVNVTAAVRSSDAMPVGGRMKYLRNNFQTQVSIRSLSYFNKYQ